MILKYQVIITLNDFIRHLSDLYNESTDDTVMIRESKLQKQLNQIYTSSLIKHYFIY